MVKKKLHILLVLCLAGASSYANNIDSLLKVTEQFKNANHFNNLSKAFRYVNLDSSSFFAKEAISKGNIENNSEQVAYGYFNLAIVLLIQGKYYAAIEHFNKAERYFKKANISSKNGAINNNLGNCYYSTAQYQKALTRYEKALQIKKEENNENAIPLTLHNIGDVFFEWGKYENALDLYYNALEYYDKIDDSYHKAITLNSIGTVYQNLKIFQKALDYYNASLENYKKNKMLSSEEAAVLSNIGNIYFYDIKNIDKAEDYYNKSLKIYLESNNKLGQSIINNSLGYIFIHRKDYIKAEELFKLALTIAQEEKNNKQIYTNYIALSELYELKNQYKSALDYYKKYIEIKDSVFDEKGQIKLADFEAKYELFVKEKELEALKIKSEIENIKKSDKNKKEIIIISIVCLTLLLLSIFIVKYLKPNFKEN